MSSLGHRIETLLVLALFYFVEGFFYYFQYSIIFHPYTCVAMSLERDKKSEILVIAYDASMAIEAKSFFREMSCPWESCHSHHDGKFSVYAGAIWRTRMEENAIHGLWNDIR